MSERGRWLVAVCAGRWQVHAIRCARRAGIRVLALDGDPSAPGLAIADRAQVVDVRDVRAVIATVEASGIDPAGAVSISSEAGMLAAGALRDRFGLPGHGRHVARALTNKAIQRALGSVAGVPAPRWLVASSARDAERALATIGLPAVVKPADSAGSRGVSRIDQPSQLAAAARHALAMSRLGDIVIEEAMPGPEFTVETFSVAGQTWVLAITEKTQLPGSRTVSMELATCHRPPLLLSRIADVACRALDALGHRDGPGHTEVMLDRSGEPALVESAGRGGGFGVFDYLVPAASGFDIATATVRQAVGAAIPPPHIHRKPAVLRFVPSRAGEVTRIDGFDRAAKVPGVIAESLVSVGAITTTVSGDGDRLALVVASADTPQAARSRADQACQHIHIEVTPDASHRHASTSG